MFWAEPPNTRVNGLVFAFVFCAIHCSTLHAEKLPVKTYTKIVKFWRVTTLLLRNVPPWASLVIRTEVETMARLHVSAGRVRTSPSRCLLERLTTSKWA